MFDIERFGQFDLEIHVSSPLVYLLLSKLSHLRFASSEFFSARRNLDPWHPGMTVIYR